jgi:poly-beta-hydroxyalkanoate depolymerase
LEGLILTEKHEFKFDVVVPNNVYPSVARIFWNFDRNDLDKKYVNLLRLPGDTHKSVYGNYSLDTGEIVQHSNREGDKEIRKWYIATAEGELKEIVDFYSSDGTSKLILAVQYLRKLITAEYLLSTI